MGRGGRAPLGARGTGCVEGCLWCWCCKTPRPHFEDGEWVMVRRNGNRVGKKTLGRVVKSWPTTVARGGTNENRSEWLVYQYEIKWHVESTQGRDCNDPQNEAWLSPAAPPPAASAASAGAGDASSEAKAAQGARLSGLEAQPEPELEPEPQAKSDVEPGPEPEEAEEVLDVADVTLAAKP